MSRLAIVFILSDDRRMKILVTGAEGLLGKEIVAMKRDGFEVVGTDYSELDVTDLASIKKAFLKERPEVVVNCAVILNVDLCQENPNLCFGVNRDGVSNILKVFKELGKPVIFFQISSSEVFGRVKEGEYQINGYAEDDIPMPVSNYQKSKAEAEKIVTDFARQNPEILPRFYILRAAWLYGKGRRTFVENFLADLQQPKELSVIADQWRSPTWAKHFVDQLFLLLEKNYPNGIYHGVAEVLSGEATTPQVIEEISKFLGPNKVKATIKKVKRDDFFKVPRAPSNVLKNTKLPKLPYWRETLREFFHYL